eukprot:363371-Chlamydomonas_euryale.AAC.19
MELHHNQVIASTDCLHHVSLLAGCPPDMRGVRASQSLASVLPGPTPCELMPRHPRHVKERQLVCSWALAHEELEGEVGMEAVLGSRVRRCPRTWRREC